MDSGGKGRHLIKIDIRYSECSEYIVKHIIKHMKLLVIRLCIVLIEILWLCLMEAMYIS